MTDGIDNLIIEHLKALRAELASVKTDTTELKQRLSHLEIGVAAVRRDAAHDQQTSALQQLAMDRLAERVDRIERRLDLV